MRQRGPGPGPQTQSGQRHPGLSHRPRSERLPACCPVPRAQLRLVAAVPSLAHASMPAASLLAPRTRTGAGTRTGRRFAASPHAPTNRATGVAMWAGGGCCRGWGPVAAAECLTQTSSWTCAAPAPLRRRRWLRRLRYALPARCCAPRPPHVCLTVRLAFARHGRFRGASPARKRSKVPHARNRSFLRRPPRAPSVRPWVHRRQPAALAPNRACSRSSRTWPCRTRVRARSAPPQRARAVARPAGWPRGAPRGRPQ
mmetsp:Transcript_3494/g.10832  ORF Transcript_3494/g.10832 Transcript_3494/m.10832 type:complete len:256 (-) Transcript_3494:201-968(-)